MLVLFQPIWLVLLLPLMAVFFSRPLPTRLLSLLRAVAFLVLVLAMCFPAIKLSDQSGTVIVVADRSESMPPQAGNAQKEIIDLLRKSMGPRDLLGVVSFGRLAVVERSPQRGDFSGFTGQVGPEHSNLSEALEAALALIPPDSLGSLLVLSDGKWTGKDPAAAGARAAGRSIPIDHRVLNRPQVNEVAIQSFVVPNTVLPAQAYMLNAWVQSPTEQDVQYQLRRGSTMIASGTKTVSPGLSRLVFRDRASASGVQDYTLVVNGAANDPIPENNQARALVGVEGPRPILHVSQGGENSGLTRLLHAGGLEAVAKTPGQSSWSLEDLAQYSAVVLENVNANQIGANGMETLASWVEDTGSGLMMTGGQKAYGPGGYFKSPLERIMPLSMEMRREHRKLSLAIVVALDRSGSMAAPAGNGKRKIDLANIGTVQVLDLLSPNDELGVIAVDSSPHTIVPIDSVEKNQSSRGQILAIDSMGGGIFIYEALAAAAQMILTARSENRHIILFADAADSEEPGRYEELLEKYREANISVSVVGLGTEHDSDADLLKRIAELGGGTCYFTSSPEEIPRLFAQDTFTVARSTFVDQETPFELTTGFSALGSVPPAMPPALGGYNLCYIRPQASLAAVTKDEHQAPVVAAWNAGNGRVLCFTGEADGKFSGPLADWNQVGDFYATLARWASGQRQPLPKEMLLTQEVRDGVCWIQLHLDPERQAEPFSVLPRVRILHGLPGQPPAKQSVSMQWKTADLLEAAIPIEGRETVLNTVEVPGQQPVSLSPVCLPYSPEFAPDQPGRGPSTLAKLAATTGGKERIEIPQIWKDMPYHPRYVEITPWLLVFGLVVFLLEILERRTGLIARVFIASTARPNSQSAPELEPVGATSTKPASRIPGFGWLGSRARLTKTDAAATKRQPMVGSRSAGIVEVPAKEAQPPDNLDAYRKARERAERRTGK